MSKTHQALIYCVTRVKPRKDSPCPKQRVQPCEQEQFLCRALILKSWFMRLRGLLGTAPNAMPVVLERCSSIHTFGMRYPIDVAFLNKDGMVLLAKRQVPPRLVLRVRGARRVVERPSHEGWWPTRGERLCARVISHNALFRPQEKQGGDYGGTRRAAA